MYARQSILTSSYICKRCTTRIFTPLQSRNTRPYASATTSRSLFPNYFTSNNCNSQWTPNSPSRQSRGVSHIPVASQDTYIPPTLASTPISPSIAGYKPVPALTARRLLKVYTELSKTRLTILVVLTAMSGVALSPLPATIPVLLSTAVGTALCSASANTLNQIQEVPFDAQMTRTRNRPLVRRAITPIHATAFAVSTGALGTGILWTMVNPTTALLGLANIGLYAGVYTYLKRTSIVNTWVGAVVGALPPLMGWTACGGHLLPSTTYPIHTFLPSFLSDPSLPINLANIDNPLGALALFWFLFSWQFPHFMALSHFTRASYAQAGYKMLAVLDPKKNALVALRHSVLYIPLCSVLFPLSGLTTWAFAITSLPINIVCVLAAWKFWKNAFGDGEKEARKVWNHCLWFLPVMLGLMMVHKQGVEWGSWLGLTSSSSQDSDNTEENNVAQPAT
ncbi:UbiA prenyltransferase family-domain-containing protein [Abortiporus biennis]|nr:UbiA prenyltransferase family-domain-containing protein [Abortiporus biennis]